MMRNSTKGVEEDARKLAGDLAYYYDSIEVCSRYPGRIDENGSYEDEMYDEMVKAVEKLDEIRSSRDICNLEVWNDISRKFDNFIEKYWFEVPQSGMQEVIIAIRRLERLQIKLSK